MLATAQDIPTFPEFNVKPIQSIVKITREILRIKSGEYGVPDFGAD